MSARGGRKCWLVCARRSATAAPSPGDDRPLLNQRLYVSPTNNGHKLRTKNNTGFTKTMKRKQLLRSRAANCFFNGKTNDTCITGIFFCCYCLFLHSVGKWNICSLLHLHCTIRLIWFFLERSSRVECWAVLLDIPTVKQFCTEQHDTPSDWTLIRMEWSGEFNASAARSANTAVQRAVYLTL